MSHLDELKSCSAKNKTNTGMTPPFLPALNAVLRSLPQQAGFLSVGLPGSAFERTVRALRPDLVHVPTLSTDLLAAFPQYSISLLGSPIPRMVLGPQAGEAVVSTTHRLGGAEFQTGPCRLTVRTFSEVVTGMRHLALLYVDEMSHCDESLTTMCTMLETKDTLLWIDQHRGARELFPSWVAKVGQGESYSVFTVSDAGRVSLAESAWGPETRALILVPDKHWHHEHFAEDSSGQGQPGRLLAKTRVFPAGLVERWAALPVADRAMNLPRQYECQFGEGVFADNSLQSVEAAPPAQSLQIQGSQVSRILIPLPPLDSFSVSLVAAEMPADPACFAVTLRSGSYAWPMVWGPERGGFVTQMPVVLREQPAFVEIEVAAVDRLSPSHRSLTVYSVEISSCDYVARAGLQELQILLTDRDTTCR